MKKSILFFAAFLSMASLMAQEKKVLVMEIKDVIDPRMHRYVDLALKDAEHINADIVIIEMDTYGGVLTDAKDIVDRIMHFKKPVWVFINSDAASAGALISIACDSIYMSPGASIGAATVVDGQGQKAPDKYQSYMRSIMRSTAEENGRDPAIAEGMVDEDLEIKGIKEAGHILTFSTSEALEHGYCEAKVESIQEILERNHISNYAIHNFQLGFSERIIRFVLNPVISSILILVIIAGIYFEMQTPGVGFAGLAALTALIVYLVPYYLNGLAENWEILAFIIGIGLIALEIFVIPGFGVTGIAGIALTVGSLFLIMINNDAFDFKFVPMNELLYAMAAAMGGTLGGMILLLVGGSRLPDTRFFRKIALTETQNRAEGYVSTQFTESLVGKRGTAETVLRPSGKVMIDGKMFDAYTRGDYIDKGQPVEVISDEGSSLKVKIVSKFESV
ncbi:MAG TPA: NfeD family protein [Chryseosolibacter sp.]